jgi:hypothetical protein
VKLFAMAIVALASSSQALPKPPSPDAIIRAVVNRDQAAIEAVSLPTASLWIQKSDDSISEPLPLIALTKHIDKKCRILPTRKLVGSQDFVADVLCLGQKAPEIFAVFHMQDQRVRDVVLQIGLPVITTRPVLDRN